MAAAELQSTLSPVVHQDESRLRAFKRNQLARRGAAVSAVGLMLLTGCTRADAGDTESQYDPNASSSATSTSAPGATTAPGSTSGTYPRGGWERTGPGSNNGIFGPSEKADQELLIFVGCLPEGSADGYVSEDPNSQTVRAIKAAQTALGVSVDGWIGPEETRPGLVKAAAAGEEVCAVPIDEIATQSSSSSESTTAQEPAAAGGTVISGCPGTPQSEFFAGGEATSPLLLCPDN